VIIRINTVWSGVGEKPRECEKRYHNKRRASKRATGLKPDELRDQRGGSKKGTLVGGGLFLGFARDIGGV